MRRGHEEDDENSDINSRMKGYGNGYPPGYNGMNNGLYGRNGFGGRGGLSPEQMGWEKEKDVQTSEISSKEIAEVDKETNLTKTEVGFFGRLIWIDKKKEQLI